MFHNQENAGHLFICDDVVKFDRVFVIFHLREVSHNLDFTHNLYGVIELTENVLNSFNCNNFSTFAVYGLYNLAIGTGPNQLRKLIVSLKQLPCVRQAGHLLLRLFLLNLLHSFILNILFLLYRLCTFRSLRIMKKNHSIIYVRNIT